MATIHSWFVSKWLIGNCRIHKLVSCPGVSALQIKQDEQAKDSAGKQCKGYQRWKWNLHTELKFLSPSILTSHYESTSSPLGFRINSRVDWDL